MNQKDKLTEATMRALQGKLNEGWTADGRDCWDVYEKELNALVKNAPDTFKPYGEYNFIYTPKNVYVALRPETLTDENDGKPEMDFVIFATADDMTSDYDSNIGIDWQDISDPEKYWEYVAKYADKVADKFKTSTKKENKSIKTEAKTANDSEDYFTFVLGYDLLQDKFAKENLECDTAYEKASKITEDFMNSEEYKDKSKSGYDALVDYLQNNKLTENKKIVEDEKFEINNTPDMEVIINHFREMVKENPKNDAAKKFLAKYDPDFETWAKANAIYVESKSIKAEANNKDNGYRAVRIVDASEPKVLYEIIMLNNKHTVKEFQDAMWKSYEKNKAEIDEYGDDLPRILEDIDPSLDWYEVPLDDEILTV